jgi:hypothetical protein
LLGRSVSVYFRSFYGVIHFIWRRVVASASKKTSVGDDIHTGKAAISENKYYRYGIFNLCHIYPVFELPLPSIAQ